MITEWFYALATQFVGWIASDVMTWDAAPEVESVMADLGGMIANVGSLGVWIDWSAAFLAVGTALAVWLACFGVKFLLRAASHAPVIGGAG